MERIGVREMHENASGYRTSRDRMVAAGRLVPASAPTGRVRDPRPVAVAPGEPANAELLEADRAERL